MQADATMYADSAIQTGDENLFVKFFKKPMLNQGKSEKAGYPVYEDQEMISIIVPGSVANMVERRVKPDDKERFYKQWNRYINNMQDAANEGMPIEQWPQISASLAETLKAVNFRTVESLANATDVNLQKLMGGYDLREKAKAFLKVAKDTAAAQEYAVENARLSKEIEELKAQVAKLAAIAEDKQARRGRPPKED